MNVANPKDKRQRLKRFLAILSQDASLMRGKEADRMPLAELLAFAGYDLRKETAVDLAGIVDEMLARLGIEADADDMMTYVLNGGTVGEFMNFGWKEGASFAMPPVPELYEG